MKVNTDRTVNNRPFGLIALLLVTLSGCNSEKRYSLTGHVLAKDEDIITISHDAIKGLMPAMTMPYQVKDTAMLAQIQRGDTIRGTLVIAPDDHSWLESVTITDQSGRDTLPSVTEDDLQPGAEIPEVPLIDQDGRRISLRDYRGKAVLVTFIYTRCPFANFCPLLSNEFASLRRDLLTTPGDLERIQLVSISLDPAWDTPPVMREYGLRYLHGDAAGFSRWTFASVSPDDLKKLAEAFGLTYVTEGKLITHNLRTVLLGVDGTVVKLWSGNQWRKEEILNAVRQAASEGGKKP
jgi:protein SCO1/2